MSCHLKMQMTVVIVRICLSGLCAVTSAICADAQKPTPIQPMMHEKSADMDTIHSLFGNTGQIKRTIHEIPEGLEVVTESKDPATARLIKKHAADMRRRLKGHVPIRAWDPLFKALFDHADKIDLKVTETTTGVHITETTADPETLRIIRAHAAAVSGFIHDGPAGMAKRHELPGATPTARAAFLGKGDGIRTCPVTGEPVDKKVTALIKGRTVYFCCQSCVDVVRKNPEKFLKPLQRRTQ